MAVAGSVCDVLQRSHSYASDTLPGAQVDLSAIEKLYEYGRLQFGFGAYEHAALYLANYRVLVCGHMLACCSVGGLCGDAALSAEAAAVLHVRTHG